MKVIGIAAIAAAVGLGGPALAQEQASPAAPAAPAAAAPSDSDVTKFATIMMRFQDLQKQGKGGDQEAMAAVLADVGLSIEDYNKMTTAMRSDTALNERISAAYRSVVTSQSPAPAAGAAQN